MMHRSFASTLATHTPIGSAQLESSLISPFSYTLSIGDPNMIKQAALQHPQSFSKLQHRLYETDSDSSFDLAFSSPSSIGSNSEYSDVGYHSSSRSRTSSHGLSRRMGSLGPESRSESISSVLGSSIAIQRLLMGTNPPSSSLRNSHRQSVRAIASAFEEVGRNTSAPKQIGSQLGRVDQVSAPVQQVQGAGAARQQTLDQTLNQSAADAAVDAAVRPAGWLPSQSDSSSNGGFADADALAPERLKITKQSVQVPLSAPSTFAPETSQPSAWQSDARESSLDDVQFVFPARASVQRRWPYDESNPRVRSFISLNGQYDDEEPAFDIVLSPSQRRNFELSFAAEASTALVQLPELTPRESASMVNSPHLRSSISAASRNSMDSTYSHDSHSGHPFSLQLPDHDNRTNSSASTLDLDEMDAFTSPFIGNSSTRFINPPVGADEVSLQQMKISPPTPSASVEQIVPLARASKSILQPLTLSVSRSSVSLPSSASSSSASTLTPSATASTPTLMRVNGETAFPLPPWTAPTRAGPTTTASFSRAMLSGSQNFAKKDGIETTKSAAQPTREAGPLRTLALGSGSGADRSLAIAELKREARALLDSIRNLGDDIDNSIPPTHRLTGSACRATATNSSSPASSNGGSAEGATTASFVAVDASYSDVWRLMDSWYWSSFHVAPTTATPSS